MFPNPGHGGMLALVGLVSALFAYLGTLLFGLPTYRYVQKRRWTSPLTAALIGFMTGALTWIVFLLAFGLILGNSWALTVKLLTHGSVEKNIVDNLSPALLGALVGLTAWFIIRPRKGEGRSGED